MKTVSWDFWYLFRDGIVHVYFLCAPDSLKLSNRHHFAAELGYVAIPAESGAAAGSLCDAIHAATDWNPDAPAILLAAADRRGTEYRDDSIPASGWDDTAIWSGDTLFHEGSYYIFYTSRFSGEDDGMTQRIGVARSGDAGGGFVKIPGFHIGAFPGYATRGSPFERTPHAWRDPFLYRSGGTIRMALSAKRDDPAWNRRGCIARLRLAGERLDEAMAWVDDGPVDFPSDCRVFGECEVPQVYADDRDGTLVYLFSCWPDNIAADLPARFKTDPRQDMRAGGLFCYRETDRKFELLVEADTAYACRVIPEWGGAVVGFDSRRDGSAMALGFKCVPNRLPHLRPVRL